MTTILRRHLLAFTGALLLAAGSSGAALAAVELTMYYPVAVGGPLTKIVDGLVADFHKEHPDIKVNAIYAGNYNDARIKALAALKSGQPAQLSVMFSIDIYELIEQDAIVAFADGKWHHPGQNLGHSVPAFDHCHVLQQGRLPRCRA